MEAKIDRSSGIAVPNFAILTKEPLTFYVDIITPELDQRFVCPVDLEEFENYMRDVKGFPEYEISANIIFVNQDSATDAMASFLNEKSKDWKICNEDNEIINQ